MPLPDSEVAADASAGDGFTIVCTRSGKLFTFGDIATENWRPTLHTNISDVKCVNVSAGSRHALILAENGTVFGIGNNYSCELGLGHDNADKPAPVLIAGLSNITTVRAYKASSFAINGKRDYYFFLLFFWGIKFC